MVMQTSGSRGKCRTHAGICPLILEHMGDQTLGREAGRNSQASGFGATARASRAIELRQ
jgi:hypothetical protein